MLFNTLDFIVFFVVVVGLISLFKFRKFQYILVIISSFYFIFYTDNFLVALLILTILLHFYIGREIHKSKDPKKRKIFFIIGVLGSLSLLGFFKYYDFAITQFNIFGDLLNLENQIPLLNLALPIGISFYTFQSLSYIIDIYRGSLEPAKSLKEYAFFVAFFPALVAGPILRARNFLPQLREKIAQANTSENLKLLVINNSNLKFGLTLMSFGFFKKMFFADNIAPFVDEIFLNPVGLESFSIILGSIAFGIQIYCDFSGYSDIAIGAAAILGFKIPLNFNKPFFATSPSDFWARWHISLSTWVRDYLYYPLVFKNRKSSSVVFISLLISMFLMGLWHGASWNFLIWGGLHGIFLAVFTVLRNKYSKPVEPFFKSKFGKFFSIFVTQYLVFFTFIAFVVQDLDHMWYAMKKYVILDFATEQTIEIISENEFAILLITLFVGLHYISYRQGNLPEKISKLKLRYWILFLIFIILPISLFYVGSAQEFIYFQF
jgi:D-alanyl-lipoteichoic acid acyltransferase DltB (MBOAT superfamily)